MLLKLQNTLSSKKERFEPISKGKVLMYNCGPTVYNFATIGNLRSYVFADLLKRVFEYGWLQVTQVINITDVGHLSSDSDDGEDKMTSALKRESMPITVQAMKEIGEKYTNAFKEDLKKLNIDITTIKFPRASDHIVEQIDLIKKIEKKGLCYKTSDGVYFSSTNFPNYGRLKKGSSADNEARIAHSKEKKSPTDFALWKFNAIGWESPWGGGFPGWHIECSAMSMKYLGDFFDVHTGGIDHIPIHHNNEIAQSEAATGKTLAKYWLHHAHLVVDDKKMSKSLGNVYYLSNIIDRGYSPLSYRYFLLQAHYSTQVNFTWQALEAAHISFANLLRSFHELGKEEGKINERYQKLFSEAISDDLNTSLALSIAHEVLKDSSLSPEDKKATIADFDRVFGLDIANQSKIFEENIPDAVLMLVKKRESARDNQNWKEADELRQEINSLGYEIEDSDQGPKIYPKI